MKTRFRRILPVAFPLFTAAFGMGLAPKSAGAQIVAGPAPALPPLEGQDRITQGRILLDNADPRAIDVLRDASQKALGVLNATLGHNALDDSPGTLPTDVLTNSLQVRAAEAHAYWGFACEQFGRRDESITAWTRAIHLSALSRYFTGGTGLIGMARQKLNLLLDNGLPLVAPDDVMTSLDSLLRQGAWSLRSEVFDAGSESSDIGGKPLPRREFLITTGKLLPPRATLSAQDTWFKVPSYYSNVELSKLPLSLQLDKMVAGYAREVSGPNKGLWRQIVRVYYASPILTQNQRDDQPRARRLVEQFLKVHALYTGQLSAANLYASGDKDAGVTTLWLLEVSALWPADEDDPRVVSQLGPRMPALNVAGGRPSVTPETTALVRPWQPIAGQNEGAPGEILFWKASQSRPENEWLRELFHEYGHVALPPIGGFRPPLEPYGNGVMGETLGMLWAAGVPDALAPQLDASSMADRAQAGGLKAAYLAHVNSYARPARVVFINQGPDSILKADGTRAGLQYLSGLTVYLERVYGGKLAGRVLNPLSQQGSGVQNIARRRSLLSTSSLLNSLPTRWHDPWGNAKTLPLWLPGAMGVDLSASALANRDPLALRAKSLVPVWLWVPPGTDWLRIDGAGAGNLRAVGLPFQPGKDMVRIYFPGQPGWQKFVINAERDAQIAAAQFERK